MSTKKQIFKEVKAIIAGKAKVHSSLVKGKHFVHLWNMTPYEIMSHSYLDRDFLRNVASISVETTVKCVAEMMYNQFQSEYYTGPRMEVFQVLVKIIQDLVGHGQPIKLESTYRDVGADSLDLIEFIMAIEDEYEIEISDQVAERFVTVNDVVNHILNQGAVK